MISDGLALSHFYSEMLQESTMQSVVTKVVDIILGPDWDDDDKVENQLANVRIQQLTDDFVIRVLEGLQNRPLKAYKFFHWVGKQSGYQHNTVTYNYVARVLAKMDSIEEFWSIEEMKSVGHELDLNTSIKISRQLQENRMMDGLHEHMMDSSYKPSVLDCIMLLKNIAESDEPVYDGILKSFTSAGKFDEAQIIVKTMTNAGYKPHKLTHNEIASGLCKLRRFEEASKVIDEMQACGCFTIRGVYMMVNDYEVIKTWKILIKGYCDAGELDKALLSLAKMIEQNLAGVDDDLFEVLVDALLTQGRIDGAYKLFLKLTGKYGIYIYQKLLHSRN
ncbi:putative pentatricopeptide [Medicago truncatula]|uniref:Putative pentatricopeptide n=1 Tax=Medicago truncatula TaxID=3880 RepID=A0A396HZ22_MEDTR|nr:putative pentatricopeptide [Medicago truncatula]